jgi:hypothetical protein
MPSSRMWCRVGLVRTDVSEELHFQSTKNTQAKESVRRLPGVLPLVRPSSCLTRRALIDVI